jgi:hypothetical protein
MLGFRATVLGTLVIASSLLLSPVGAHPIGDLIRLTARIGGRTLSAGSVSLELRATRLALDREFRAAMLADLEATGDRALAVKLGRAWERAEIPGYRSIVENEVQLLRVIEQVSPSWRGAAVEIKDEFTAITDGLLNDALNDVPLSAFSSKEALEKALIKSLTERAKAEATSEAPKFSFEISSGKLSIPFKGNVLGLEIKVGDINIYKLGAAAAAAIACREVDCLEKAALALFNEKEKEGSHNEPPEVTMERLRREALREAANDDPLHQFLIAAMSEGRQ